MRGRLCRLGSFQEMRSQARWNYFWEIKVCISSILLYFAPNSCSQSPIYSQNVSEVGSSWKHYKVENIPIFAIAPGINCPTFSSRGKKWKKWVILCWSLGCAWFMSWIPGIESLRLRMTGLLCPAWTDMQSSCDAKAATPKLFAWSRICCDITG